jgi:nicotinate phosphoribosyltransferase
LANNWICNYEEIKKGETADIYFERVLDVLKKAGKADVNVTAEFSGDLPTNYSWGIFAGLEEVLSLLEGKKLDVWSMPEGNLFREKDEKGVEEPVMIVRGAYSEFAKLETAILGIISYSSGVATSAARVKLAAQGKPVYAFGIRRVHPALAAIADRAAYIGGVDGVSGIAAAKRLGIRAVGTMPHSYVLIMGSPEAAWSAFDKYAEEDVPRVMLCDTLYDEKTESLMAARLLKKRLFAVRLDTPKSRKGDFEHLVREVRWELDTAGFSHVKIMVSGGLNEYSVRRLSIAGADMFGVGTAISAAKPIDFSLDVCEIEGKPVSKRGRFSGAKQVYRCVNCFSDYVTLWEKSLSKCEKCGAQLASQLVRVMHNGSIVFKESAESIRKRALEHASKVGIPELSQA